jgi:hypothetical protein
MPIQRPVHPVLPPILGAYEVQLRKGLGDLNPDLPSDRIGFATVMTNLWRSTRWETLLEMADFLGFEDRNTHDRVVRDIACSWAYKYAEAIKKAKISQEFQLDQEVRFKDPKQKLENPSAVSSAVVGIKKDDGGTRIQVRQIFEGWVDQADLEPGDTPRRPR